MKKSRTLIYSKLLMLSLLIGLSACKKKASEAPAPLDNEAVALNGDWYLPASGGGIVVDGIDRSMNYEGFVMSFTNGQDGMNKAYTTINAGALFRSSGTWDWASTAKTSINFDDGKVLNIQSRTSTRLVITFNHTSGGVRAGISGSYVMTLEKR